jgi:hypothetical protein
MGKKSVHQKLQVLKVYLEDLKTDRKVVRQPQWLKEILNKNEPARK